MTSLQQTATKSGRSVPAGRLSSGLALQFLMSCWLGCLEELPALALDADTLPTKDRPRLGMRRLQQTEEALRHLVGDPHDEQFSPLHGGTAGVLPRLWLLAQQLPNATRLADACRTMLAEAQLALGRVAAAQTLPRSAVKSRHAARAVERIHTPLERIHRALFREVVRCSDDENIVFFLVRNAQAIDKFVGKGTVSGVLSRMFAGGSVEAQSFLIERYTIRGFTNLLPTIMAAFSAVETLEL